MNYFLIALQFLTILPIKIKSEIKEKDFGRSLLYFPIVGLMIGLLLSVTAFFLSFLPGLIKGAIILSISIFITGGIHLDGFADTCDGLYAGKSKERILEIMRDPHIGTMGIIALVCLLLLKFTLIIGIPKDLLWKSFIMMAAFSRWSQGLACYSCKYVRENGKAKFFIEYARKKDIVIGALFIFGLFFFLARLKGTLIFIASSLPTLLFIEYVKRKINGMTGDTIGATSEIAEVSTLFFVLAFGSIWN